MAASVWLLLVIYQLLDSFVSLAEGVPQPSPSPPPAPPSPPHPKVKLLGEETQLSHAAAKQFFSQHNQPVAAVADFFIFSLI